METLTEVEKLAHEIAARCGIRINTPVRVVDGHEKLVIATDSTGAALAKFNRAWRAEVEKNRLFARYLGPPVN